MSLEALEKADDRRRMANTLNILADQYREFGEWQKASAVLDRALAIGRNGGDPRFLARTLYYAGNYYYTLGENEIAESNGKEALELAKTTGEKETEVATLNLLAGVYSQRGEHDRAIAAYMEAGTQYRERHDDRALADVLWNVGRTQLRADRLADALASAEECIRLAEATGFRDTQWRGITLRARIREQMGDAKAHAADLELALEIARELKINGFLAENLEMRASDEVHEGRLDEARRDVEEALADEEAAGARNLDRELRQTQLARRSNNLTRLYVDVLMRLDRKQPGKGLAARALEVAENVRARDLLDTLELAGGEVAKGVAPALLEEERGAQRRLVGKQDLVVRLTSEGAPKEQIAAAEHEAEEARARYRDVWTRIRAASPAYAALRQPEPPTLDALEREALDADTVLLEYSLGDEASYLWVVTPKGVANYDLGPGKPIEAAVARVRQLLTARACREHLESDDEWAARVARADADFPAAAAELSRLVLAPAGLIAAKRVAVVADGPLQLVPFSALPEAATGQPLVVAHEIVSLPSAGALAAQRRQLAGRAPAAKSVAILADPVYEADDARLGGVAVEKKAGEKEPSGVAQARGAGCGDRAGLARLPGTRAEAEAISALVPKADRLEALGFDANLELVSSERLRAYRIVHFATHGYAPATRPDLAGVVLSLYDKQGHRKDGFLGLYGLYKLDVPAELVVLSGCETAVGSMGGSDGLVGVARGFMYAGARRVVASLWKVDDQATAELMKRFYGAILKGNRTPAAALREAQLEMLRSKDHAAPFFWASFDLYGEWR
jgi:CHAT domain-containing protein